MHLRDNAGFTLIELLIVVAILGVLAAAVTIVLNPVELMEQSRDGQRFSDIDTLNKSISLYQTENTTSSLGNSNTVYISIADASSTCGDLGLPTLPSGWTYYCSATPSKSDGTGWIPINFKINVSSELPTLPIDPVNSTSSGLYYTYVASSNTYELTGLLESTKYRSQEEADPPVPYYPGVLAEGTSLSISPLFNPSGLIGYWNFNEGSGTTANDSSGNGYIGTLSGSTLPTWISGKTGGGLSFNGSTSYVSMPGPNMSAGSSTTVAAWVYPESGAGPYPMIIDNASGIGLFMGINIGSNGAPGFNTYFNSTLQTDNVTIPSLNSWYYVVGTYDGSNTRIYVNGVLMSTSGGPSTSPGYSGGMTIGNGSNAGNSFWDGYIDDVRIYNRALSAAEIRDFYNATK